MVQLKAGANRPYDVAELPENQLKNRYYDVLPFGMPVPAEHLQWMMQLLSILRKNAWLAS